MMTMLSDLFDLALLDEMVSKGYVSTTDHPSENLRIYGYTPSAQYERVWNEVTLQTRGLIVDRMSGEVVARPFPKFFNYAEVIEQGLGLPEGDFVVSDKLDGSLGIIYTYKGRTAVATRGSFTSDQALWATKHLMDNYPNFVQPEGVTTLVEIIYPQNRIVVDYGGLEALVLLGAVFNETGEDVPPDEIFWWPGPRAEQHEFSTLDDVVNAANGDLWAGGEGVVLTWMRLGTPSVRLKIKHPRYVELHRIVTGLSTRTVWEALATDTFDELLEAAPDEFHPWIRGVESELRRQFDGIYNTAHARLRVARTQAGGDSGTYTRAQLAAEITKDLQFSGLAFAIEDGKDVESRIWAMIKPERSMAMIVEDI